MEVLLKCVIAEVNVVVVVYVLVNIGNNIIGIKIMYRQGIMLRQILGFYSRD